MKVVDKNESGEIDYSGILLKKKLSIDNLNFRICNGNYQ